jgi:hypothetical protein
VNLTRTNLENAGPVAVAIQQRTAASSAGRDSGGIRKPASRAFHGRAASLFALAIHQWLGLSNYHHSELQIRRGRGAATERFRTSSLWRCFCSACSEDFSIVSEKPRS